MYRKRKVAVIAGTAVDTAMGAEYIVENTEKLDVLRYPVSGNPQEQTMFQISDPALRESKITGIIEDAISKSADGIFVYCNSLSGTVDFSGISQRYGIPVVTPLMAYGHLSREYKRVGVIAANNQSLAGIEKAFLSGNDEVEIIGTALLPVVKEIENGTEPSEIINKWKLAELMRFYEGVHAQCVVLGCTHFPYFRKELSEITELPVIDPAEHMLSTLINLL